MAKEKKSYDLALPLAECPARDVMLALVARAAAATGLYISHIGGYSRVKYPNSMHWHFKRDSKELGLIDATYWQEGGRFWLIVRHNEPPWVHEVAPVLHSALEGELSGARHGSRDG